jgi:hypothetical protein
MCRQTLGTVHSRFVVNSDYANAKIEVWQEDIFRLWGRGGDNPVIHPLAKPVLDRVAQGD